MKSIVLTTVIALFTFGTVSAQKKETVKVWGNCGMCEKTIETAAKTAGATEADWNTETKVLSVAYKAKKTDLSKIEQAIAAAGYDTQNFTAPDAAYNKLHSCCQYERKAGAVAHTQHQGDCCKGGKCEKHSMNCSECSNCKGGQGKCDADCCKDGKCSSGKACCKKA
jgi:hypothetical protein